jgi:hypothetical protein
MRVLPFNGSNIKGDTPRWTYGNGDFMGLLFHKASWMAGRGNRILIDGHVLETQDVYYFGVH